MPGSAELAKPRWAAALAQGLGAPGALGSALLGALLARHGALPAAVESGLFAAAHGAYEGGGCADALDVLVRAAEHSVRAWASAGEWRPLVQLVAGVCSSLPQCESRYKVEREAILTARFSGDSAACLLPDGRRMDWAALQSWECARLLDIVHGSIAFCCHVCARDAGAQLRCPACSGCRLSLTGASAVAVMFVRAMLELS